MRGGGGLTLKIKKVSSSYRAKIGAAGQVLAIKLTIFTILRWQRVIFAGKKCYHHSNPKHEVTPLQIIYILMANQLKVIG